MVETTWHNIVAWEGKGIPELDKLEKGSRVYVTGRVRQSKYTGNDGLEKQSYEAFARSRIKIGFSEVFPVILYVLPVILHKTHLTN